MSLFFALVLIGLPAAALLYDFYKDGSKTMLTPQTATAGGVMTGSAAPTTMAEPPPPHRPMSESSE